MKTALAVAMIGAVLCWSPAVAADDCAASPDALRPALEARYTSLHAAMAARDRDGIDKLLAPDFISEDTAGHAKSGSAYMAEIIATPPDPLQISTSRVLSLDAAGDHAEVGVSFRMKTSKVALNGAKHEVEMVALSTDDWVCSDAGWRLRRTAVDQVTVTVDGRVAIHNVRTAGK